MRDFLCQLSNWNTVNFPSAILQKPWAFLWRQDPSCSNICEKRKGYVSLLNSILAFEWKIDMNCWIFIDILKNQRRSFFSSRDPGNYHMLKLKNTQCNSRSPSKSANDFGWKFAVGSTQKHFLGFAWGGWNMVPTIFIPNVEQKWLDKTFWGSESI